jgi:hypothetical protein
MSKIRSLGAGRSSDTEVFKVATWVADAMSFTCLWIAA